MSSTNGPAALRFHERIGAVTVFTCAAHNHGNLPQFYAAGPAADCGGHIERLPADAFQMSGTNVQTMLAVIPAPVHTTPEPAPEVTPDPYAEAEAAGMLFA